MGKSGKVAANPLHIKELVKVWQRKTRQVEAASFLLPHQQHNLFSRFSCLHRSLTAQPRRFRRQLTRKARRTLTDIAFMLALGIVLPAKAATLLVNSNVPDVNPDGLCSLIEAIDNANADAQLHADCLAGSGADTVQLQSGSIHRITAALSGLPAQGLPSISTQMWIEGNGATLHVTSVLGDRVIDVTDSGELTLSDASISGDADSGTSSNAPRIHNQGHLQLSNVSIPMELNIVAGVTNLGTMTANNLQIYGLCSIPGPWYCDNADRYA